MRINDGEPTLFGPIFKQNRADFVDGKIELIFTVLRTIFSKRFFQKILAKCSQLLRGFDCTLQISIGWLSVISTVIPLALIGFYL